jgi:hypothetical protein
MTGRRFWWYDAHRVVGYRISGGSEVGVLGINEWVGSGIQGAIITF